MDSKSLGENEQNQSGTVLEPLLFTPQAERHPSKIPHYQEANQKKTQQQNTTESSHLIQLFYQNQECSDVLQILPQRNEHRNQMMSTVNLNW